MKHILTVLLLSASQVTLASTEAWEFSGSVVLTHQGANKAGIDNDTSASADLVIIKKDSSGHWFSHIEANTLQSRNGVSYKLPEANADACVESDENSLARIQLSELYYQLHYSKDWALSVGLLDVSGFFEQSRIASDENTQFLGAFFVGNPTIEFPDYTLGLVSEYGLTQHLTFRAAVAGSKGLAYNPRHSYSKLLEVEDGDGIYSIASLSWESEHWLVRSGVWSDTEDHQVVASTNNSNNNYGAFMLAGYSVGVHSFNARLGYANPSISQASSFAGLAYQFEQPRYTFGAAMGHAFLSDKETNTALGDTHQYETYLRYTLAHNLFLTGDVQWIHNSNYGHLPETRDQTIAVYGARLTWLYEE